MTANGKTGHIKSNLHNCRKRYAFNVQNNEFDNPQLTQTDNILTDVNKDGKVIFFHTIQF